MVGSYLLADTVLGLRPSAPGRSTATPKITVIVPVFNEPEGVLRPVLEAWRRMDYPDYEVLLADDSDVPVDGGGFRVVRRGSREGFKGGALRNAIAQADPRSEWVAVFDADCVPARDALRRMASHFAPGVGAVQGYQTMARNRTRNLLTRFIFYAHALADLQLRGRTRYRGFVCAQGTVQAYRLEAVRSVGGVAPYLTVNEDLDTSFRLLKAGWRIVFDSGIVGDHLAPERVTTFWRQLVRWTSSTVREYRRHLPSFLASDGAGSVRKADSVAFLLTWTLTMIVTPTLFFIPLLGALVAPLPLWWTAGVTAMPFLLFGVVGATRRSLRAGAEGVLLYFLLLVPGFFVSWYAVVKGLVSEGTFNRTNKLVHEYAEEPA